MSAIKLFNSYPWADTAEFRVYQGDHQVGRLGIRQGGEASIPTSTTYTAQATTNMGDFTLTSNTVSFEENSITLLAQVLDEQGNYDFQLVASQGTQPNAIVLENTWRNPVQFTLTQPKGPVQIATAVDEHNNTSISTAQAWTVYAIVNGITTGTVEVTNPDATITLVSTNEKNPQLKVS